MKLFSRSVMEGRRYSCIPWLVVYVSCLLAFCTEIVDCIILPPIHWNASNPMFKTSNNDHVIQVNMYDELDFVCPTFEEWEDSSQFEYYIIYQVSKKEYDDCYIYPETKAIMIVNCSSPNQRKRFTILFEPFASIPHVPEFKKGGTYYYISTSTGQRDGIANVQQGACLYRNMKLTITVCCESTTTQRLPPNVTMVTSSPDPPPTPHTPSTLGPSFITITRPTDDQATTTVSTSTTTTTPRMKPSQKTPTLQPTRSTTKQDSKYTDPGLDKTSLKPVDKDKGPKDENNINKDTDEQSNNPKQQGLVNISQKLRASPALSAPLVLLSLLSWLRR